MRVGVVANSVRAATFVTVALAAGTLCAQPRAFKAGSGPDDLWDVTMKMEMPGMPMAMPAHTRQVCTKKEHKPEDLVPRNDNCRVYDVKASGNRMSYAIECTGNDAMTGTGDIAWTPTSYDGRMRMKAGRRGEEMEVTQTYTGRRVGACAQSQ